MNPAPLSGLYAPSLSLLTDLYQVTMAYGYWQQGMQDREAVFHLYFRQAPFGGGYAVAAGPVKVTDAFGTGFKSTLGIWPHIRWRWDKGNAPWRAPKAGSSSMKSTLYAGAIALGTSACASTHPNSIFTRFTEFNGEIFDLHNTLFILDDSGRRHAYR